MYLRLCWAHHTSWLPKSSIDCEASVGETLLRSSHILASKGFNRLRSMCWGDFFVAHHRSWLPKALMACEASVGETLKCLVCTFYSFRSHILAISWLPHTNHYFCTFIVYFYNGCFIFMICFSDNFGFTLPLHSWNFAVFSFQYL